ncbi:GNAT family N-acetyltransferase [Neotabrizicola sp. sgz301269]|uniref:GNAT family N-acetyltransferase n=1 Tax=Neotabrizicola sp. sgz301269 TaxID=3276282 RepID=UPI00376F9E7F
MTPRARPYAAPDREDCLALFDGNVPQFFAPEERQEFAEFLDALPECGTEGTYLVLEEAGRILACGGLALDGSGQQASLCWGMVARAHQGKGLGRALTKARLARARVLPGIERVHLATSQHTAGFYAGFGFAVTTVVPDGFGPGLDRCEMVLALSRP